MDQSRACSNCKNWEKESGECRAFPPQLNSKDIPSWPCVDPSGWCGRFKPACGAPGRAPKVSDETLIEMVRTQCSWFESPKTKEMVRVSYKRSDLVFALMELGMSRTPALKRIDTMVRRGIFQMGENPWPRIYPTPGIYVWMDDTSLPTENALPESSEATDSGMLDAIRKHAPVPAMAMSLRALHRAIEPAIPMSLTTASRRMAKLVASGDVVSTDSGYYAPTESASTAATSIDVDGD